MFDTEQYDFSVALEVLEKICEKPKLLEQIFEE